MHGWGDRCEFSNQSPGDLEASTSARNAGLVVDHKAGTARVYVLNAKPLLAINAWLRDYETLWGESMRSLKNYIEETEHQKEKNL